MPDWLLIPIGIGAGFTVLAAVIWLSFGLEGRRDKRKSWLAPRSGREDTGPSVGSGGPETSD